MTKLIIQIPCYNEEEFLGATLADLPRTVPGIDEVEWLIIDDGSIDNTAEVARNHGVDHIVRMSRHRGLASAFRMGLDACLAAGADFIVNTDADNQYVAADIGKLIAPILDGRAGMVIGQRPISEIQHFSRRKKFLQRLGSWAVRILSNTDVGDAACGFRALNRDAAMQLNVFSDFSYTLETIIQAGNSGISVCSVPIRINPDLRPSRLAKSNASYVFRSLLTMAAIFITYRPTRFFAVLGAIPFTAGFLLGVRWMFLSFGQESGSRIPSLVLSAILLLMGFQLWIVGLVTELLNANRKILEELQVSQRRKQYRKSGKDR